MMDGTEETSVDARGNMVVFGAKQIRRIRRIWHQQQWYFSVVDIIGPVTDSENPRNYRNMMKARESKDSGIQLSTFCVQLKLASTDGKACRTVSHNHDDAAIGFHALAD